MSGRIFIDYRRDDGQGNAGRLYDRLKAELGDDFVDVLLAQVAEMRCAARHHRSALADGGRWVRRCRLDNPEDWVPVEIEGALETGKHMIPVLVGGRWQTGWGLRRYGWHAGWVALASWAVLGCTPTRAADDAGTCFMQLVAAIDIGHSRSSPGAKDVLGRDELDYNVELASTIEDQLVRSGIGRVVLVNRNLDATSLPERPQRAFCAGADLFISVHHDTVDDSLKTGVVEENGRKLRYNDRVEGYTVYFSSQNEYADLSGALGLNVAEALRANGVVPATPYQDVIADKLRKPVSADLNVLDYRKLKVSQTSPIPAILLEAGFLSNRNDMRRLRSAEYRLRIARGVIEGLKAMCAKHPRLAGLNKAAGGLRLRCG